MLYKVMWYFLMPFQLLSSINLSGIKYLSFNGARAQRAGQDSSLHSKSAFYLLSLSLSDNRIIHNTIKLK